MAELEGLTLLGTSLNDEVSYGLEQIDFTPPKKRAEWAQAADSDGEGLIRTPLFNNRVITAQIRVIQQATMNAALEKVGTLVDLLQECEKNPGGSALVWTPANSTKKITFYCVTAEVTAIPTTMEGTGAGFYAKAPVLTIQFTCKPFGYGEEEEVLAAKANETGLSIVTGTIASTKGDVPAEGRIVVKDTAKVGRRFVEWGLENRYYNASTSLVAAAEALTPVGGARSEAANTGAYSPSSSKKTIATTLLPEATVCANTGVLKHIGAFRVKARGQMVLGSESALEKTYVRLSYQDGEGPLRANEWQTPIVSGSYCEIDLGTVSLTEKVTGEQKWLGQIEAYSGNTAAKDTFHINYLVFLPLEGYGKARGQNSTGAGTVVAFDNFTTGTLSGSLNTRTPAVGAEWKTSGAATDWAVEAGQMKRTTKSESEPRLAVFGSAVGSCVVTASGTLGADTSNLGVITRWVDASNYAALYVRVKTGKVFLRLITRVAGTTTIVNETRRGGAGETNKLSLSLTATMDGALAGLATIGGASMSVNASSSAIATGGALASGKPGIYDEHSGAGTSERLISAISASTLPAIPYVVQSEKSLEVRSDSTLTFDSTGTYAGPVPEYRGGRFYLPQAGQAARTSRIIVKADRNDLEAADQQTIADAFTVSVVAVPRYHVIPR